MDDIFCRIIRKEITKEFTYESENLVAFPDINPSADIHILIIPKRHIEGIKDLQAQDAPLFAEIYGLANRLVKQYNLSDNLYRIVVNGGKAQHVPHLHFHLLGGQWKKMV